MYGQAGVSRQLQSLGFQKLPDFQLGSTLHDDCLESMNGCTAGDSFPAILALPAAEVDCLLLGLL